MRKTKKNRKVEILEMDTAVDRKKINKRTSTTVAKTCYCKTSFFCCCSSEAILCHQQERSKTKQTYFYVHIWFQWNLRDNMPIFTIFPFSIIHIFSLRYFLICLFLRCVRTHQKNCFLGSSTFDFHESHVFFFCDLVRPFQYSAKDTVAYSNGRFDKVCAAVSSIPNGNKTENSPK